MKKERRHKGNVKRESLRKIQKSRDGNVTGCLSKN